MHRSLIYARYIALVATIGAFNYLFDQGFRAVVSGVRGLAVLYLFQFNLMIPLIDGGLCLIFLRLTKQPPNALRRPAHLVLS